MKQGMLLAAAALLAFATAGFSQDQNLEEAINNDNLAAVTNLLAAPESLNALPEDNSGQTPLHIAAACNRLEIARWLIAHQVNVNAHNCLGQTPLHLAAYKGFREMAALLIAAQANVNAPDLQGLTPLHMATSYGHAKVINLLLDSGADVSARTFEEGMMPIHWAAFNGHTEGLLPLLKHGADINARDSEGDTPLAWAEEYLHYDMARLIARKGGKRHIN